MGSVWVNGNEYWTPDELDATGANYRIAMGERSAGKSYAIKKKAIDEWCKTRKQFGMIRRLDREIVASKVNNYWNDIGDYAIELFKKVFEEFANFFIIAKSGAWNVYGVRDDATKTNLGVIGYYFALNTAMHYKSVAYPDVNMLVFEEFMTDSRELPNEFDTFQNLISTVKRKRTDMVIYLLGNTVNRNNLILHEMLINVRDLKQGEVKSFSYFGENNIVNTVAVEWTKLYQQEDDSEAFYTFGRQLENMIIKGLWQTKQYKHFEERDFYQDNLIMGLVLDHKDIHLYVYICQHKDNYYAYVTDKRLANRIQYITLYDGQSNLKFLKFNYKSTYATVVRISKLLQHIYYNDYISYIDNLVGCDFELVLEHLTNKIII